MYPSISFLERIRTIGFGLSSGNPEEDVILALQECGLKKERAEELVKKFGWEEALKKTQLEDYHV